jgi:hypothetical protein
MLNQMRTVGQAYGRLQDQSMRFGVAASSGMGLLSEGLSAATAAAIAFSVKYGSAVMESENLSGRIFGSMAKDVEGWSQSLEKASSVNEFEARRQAGIFFNLATSLKLPREEALKMSQRLVQLGVDLSSFHDVPIERAMQNIASGLIGNTRAMYGYGISLDQATLKSFAYEKGIAAAGSELNKQQKVLAAYGEMLRQTEAAHGDFTKSFPSSAANQTRLMMQQLRKELALTGIAMQDLLFGALRLGRDILPMVRGLVNAFSGLPSNIQAVGIAAALASGPMMRFSVAMYQAQMSSGAFSGNFAKFLVQPRRLLMTAATLGAGAFIVNRLQSSGNQQREEQERRHPGLQTERIEPGKIFSKAAEQEVAWRREKGMSFPGENARKIRRVPESERQGPEEDFGEGEQFNTDEVTPSEYPDPRNGLIGVGGMSDLRGFRAEGGGTEKGKAYVVGEKGPELFIPKEDGTVVPNHYLGRVRSVLRENQPIGDAVPQSPIGADSRSPLFGGFKADGDWDATKVFNAEQLAELADRLGIEETKVPKRNAAITKATKGINSILGSTSQDAPKLTKELPAPLRGIVKEGMLETLYLQGDEANREILLREGIHPAFRAEAAQDPSKLRILDPSTATTSVGDVNTKSYSLSNGNQMNIYVDPNTGNVHNWGRDKGPVTGSWANPSDSSGFKGAAIGHQGLNNAAQKTMWQTGDTQDKMRVLRHLFSRDNYGFGYHMTAVNSTIGGQFAPEIPAMSPETRSSFEAARDYMGRLLNKGRALDSKRTGIDTAKESNAIRELQYKFAITRQGGYHGNTMEMYQNWISKFGGPGDDNLSRALSKEGSYRRTAQRFGAIMGLPNKDRLTAANPMIAHAMIADEEARIAVNNPVPIDPNLRFASTSDTTNIQSGLYKPMSAEQIAAHEAQGYTLQGGRKGDESLMRRLGSNRGSEVALFDMLRYKRGNEFIPATSLEDYTLQHPIPDSRLPRGQNVERSFPLESFHSVTNAENNRLGTNFQEMNRGRQLGGGIQEFDLASHVSQYKDASGQPVAMEDFIRGLRDKVAEHPIFGEGPNKLQNLRQPHFLRFALSDMLSKGQLNRFTAGGTEVGMPEGMKMLPHEADIPKYKSTPAIRNYIAGGEADTSWQPYFAPRGLSPRERRAQAIENLNSRGNNIPEAFANPDTVGGFGLADAGKALGRGALRVGGMASRLVTGFDAVNPIAGAIGRMGGGDLDKLYEGRSLARELSPEEQTNLRELRGRRDAGESLNGREQRRLNNLERDFNKKEIFDAGDEVRRFTQQMEQASASVQRNQQIVDQFGERIANVNPERAANLEERQQLTAENAMSKAERRRLAEERAAGGLSPQRKREISRARRDLRAGEEFRLGQIQDLEGQYDSLPDSDEANELRAQRDRHITRRQRAERRRQNAEDSIREAEQRAENARNSLGLTRTAPGLRTPFGATAQSRMERSLLLGQDLSGTLKEGTNQLYSRRGAGIEMAIALDEAGQSEVRPGTADRVDFGRDNVNRFIKNGQGDVRLLHNHLSDNAFSNIDMSTGLKIMAHNPRASFGIERGGNLESLVSVGNFENLNKKQRREIAQRGTTLHSAAYARAMAEQLGMSSTDIDQLDNAGIQDVMKRSETDLNPEQRAKGTEQAMQQFMADPEMRQYFMRLNTDRNGNLQMTDTVRAQLREAGIDPTNQTEIEGYTGLRARTGINRIFAQGARGWTEGRINSRAGELAGGGMSAGRARFFAGAETHLMNRGMTAGFLTGGAVSAYMRSQGRDEDDVRSAEMLTNNATALAVGGLSAAGKEDGFLANRVPALSNNSRLMVNLDRVAQPRFTGGRFGALDVGMAGLETYGAYTRMRGGQEAIAKERGTEVTSGQRLEAAGFAGTLGATTLGGAYIGNRVAQGLGGAAAAGSRSAMAAQAGAGMGGLTVALGVVQASMISMNSIQRDQLVQARLQKATAQQQTEILARNLGEAAQTSGELASATGATVGALIGGALGSIVLPGLGTAAGAMAGGFIGGAVGGGALADPINRYMTGKSIDESDDQSREMIRMQNYTEARVSQRSNLFAEVAAGEEGETVGVGRFAYSTTVADPAYERVMGQQKALENGSYLIQDPNNPLGQLTPMREDLRADQAVQLPGGRADSIYGVQQEGGPQYYRDGAPLKPGQPILPGDTANPTTSFGLKVANGFEGSRKLFHKVDTVKDADSGVQLDRNNIGEFEVVRDEAREKARAEELKRSGAAAGANIQRQDVASVQAAEQQRIAEDKQRRLLGEQALYNELSMHGVDALSGNSGVVSSVVQQKGGESLMKLLGTQNPEEFQKELNKMYPEATRSGGPMSIVPQAPQQVPAGVSPVTGSPAYYSGPDNTAGPTLRKSATHNQGPWDVAVEVKVVPRNNELNKAANTQA